MSETVVPLTERHEMLCFVVSALNCEAEKVKMCKLVSRADSAYVRVTLCIQTR